MRLGGAGPLGLVCFPPVGVRPSSCPCDVPRPQCCGPFPFPPPVIVSLCRRPGSSPGAWLFRFWRRAFCRVSLPGCIPSHPVRGLVVARCDWVCWMPLLQCRIWVGRPAWHGGRLSLGLFPFSTRALVQRRPVGVLPLPGVVHPQVLASRVALIRCAGVGRVVLAGCKDLQLARLPFPRFLPL